MRRPRSAFTLTELLVCLVLLLIIAGWTLGQAVLLDDVQHRIQCASNERQIGQALLLYANENKGAYPRTTYDLHAADKPVWGTPYEGNEHLGAATKADEPADPFLKDDKPGAKYKPKVNDVTAALFLLLRTQDITGEVFQCPSLMQEKWDFGGGANTALNWTNWNGVKGLAQHLSYSYVNPYPSAKAVSTGYKLVSSLTAEFVVLADMNPGTAAVTKVNMNTPFAEMQKANSPNHSREGQNVLYADGHVEFLQTPFVGVKRDNIYSYGLSNSDHPTSGGDGIVGSPVDADDTVLLPTAHDLKTVDDDGNLKESVKPREMAAVEKAAFQKKIVGKYTREERQHVIHLQITEQDLIASAGPMTVTFRYEVSGAIGDKVRLALSAPEVPPQLAMLTVDAQGNVTIQGNQYFTGEWKRE